MKSNIGRPGGGSTLTIDQILAQRCGRLRAYAKERATKKTPAPKRTAVAVPELDFLDKANFNKKVIRNGPTECWPWIGATSRDGYGRFKIGGRLFSSHRIAFYMANGEVPDGLWVLHSCDNPRCCNSAHLFAGTPSENAQDMARKGRMFQPKAKS